MSELAARIGLMQRALARTDDKVAAQYAPRYFAAARYLAERLIAGLY